MEALSHLNQGWVINLREDPQSLSGKVYEMEKKKMHMDTMSLYVYRFASLSLLNEPESLLLLEFKETALHLAPLNWNMWSFG